MGADVERCTCENCGADDLYKEHFGKWKCYYCKTTNMCPRCVYPRAGCPICFKCQRELLK